MLISFVSRNNDLEGYWALGKLYAHALSHATNTVELDLLSGQLIPADAQFAAMIHTYSRMFARLLRGLGMPHDRVREARIRVQFDVPVQQGHYPLQSYAKPLEATLDIRDLGGSTYSLKALSWCHPHDPHIEARSTRATVEK
ncbi:hypothetical protein GCM10027321_06360 [Massilia terrae]|uniref:Uncharacterized protein n=1 Tax=Massilia terrae TaxID=1811224 RepID=A0ABT2CT46_9BURK|nr:hypothetical protein [Massilia terrae]MCS0657004.1 hypothetical protein [Massilia terrae]